MQGGRGRSGRGTRPTAGGPARDKTTTLTAEVTALETELHATCQRLETEAADDYPERGGTRELSPLGDGTDQMGGPRAAHGRPVGAVSCGLRVRVR